VASTKDYKYLVPQQPTEFDARVGSCAGAGTAQLGFTNLPSGQGPFVAPGPNSSLHDPRLTALAAELNQSVRNALPSAPVPRAQIDFLLTDMGFLVVWEVRPTDDEWRDEFGSGEGMDGVSDKSNNELVEIFDLPWGREA
jgi:hypothetical protein